MRHEIISWDTRKSPVLRENLMSHAFSINPMRKSHEIWDYLMRQKTGDFLLGGPSNKKISCLTRKSHVSCLLYKSHEKISWDMWLSHETEDRIFLIGAPPHKKISSLRRKSHVSCLLNISHEKISWDMKFSHEKEDKRFSLGGPPWENRLPHEKI